MTTKPQSILFLFFLACLISLPVAAPVLAFPPLPSSFYGTVKVNGGNVPDGTLVRALIGGQAYAQARTQTYQGDSVFNLDVPGDDSSSTGAIEGGREGDTIGFEVGGVIAGQTGIWHSGTNVRLNLTVSGPGAPVVSLPTPTATFLATAPSSSQPAPTCPVIGLALTIVVAAGTRILTVRHTG